MSDTPTPRTDAECNRILHYPHMQRASEMLYFARQLERELAAEKERYETVRIEYLETAKQLAAALAELEIHRNNYEVAAANEQAAKAERDRWREIADRLAGAAENLKHADKDYCDAAFAGPGQHPRHSPECEAMKAALADHEAANKRRAKE